MITINDHATGRLFDPWDYLGPKRRKLLETGWAGVFRTFLFEKLPVDRVARHFDDRNGRPTKELYTAIGALILQQLHDLSDPEVTRALAFNIDWHYALDISDESDHGKYLSERTLRTYRKILMQENLDQLLFETLTDALITAFGVDVSKQRLDSTLIRSNMRKLGRIRICATTVRKFLKKLQRTHPELCDAHLADAITARYLAKDADSVFSQVKPSDAPGTLEGIGNDLVVLIELFRPYETVCAMREYHMLERVLHEQFTITQHDADSTAAVKPPKDVNPGSLQNPSDPDAGYDAYKGSGYQAQIMETYQSETPDKTKPDLITYAAVEPAHINDSHALSPAIDATSTRNCKPDEIICDTLYGSDDNVQHANQNGVEIIAPAKGNTPASPLCISDFVFDPSTNAVVSCPAGHEPVWSGPTIRNRKKAVFDKTVCNACPRHNDCPVYHGKKGSYLYYDEAELRTALRRVFQQTAEFKDKYRWRAGIEATNSHLKSDLGAARLRVRGLAAVRYTIVLKALGLNILRCARALHDLFRPFYMKLSGLHRHLKPQNIPQILKKPISAAYTRCCSFLYGNLFTRPSFKNCLKNLNTKLNSIWHLLTLYDHALR